MRPPVLSSWPALWSCSIIWIFVVVGQSLVVESKPVRQPIDFVRCYNISRNLVNVVTEAILKLQDDLDGVLNCSYGIVAIEDVTANTMNTVKACLPSMHSQVFEMAITMTNPANMKILKALTALDQQLLLGMSHKNNIIAVDELDSQCSIQLQHHRRENETCICSQANRTEVDEDTCLTAIYSDLKMYMNQLQGLNPLLDKTAAEMMLALKVHDEDQEPGEEPPSGKTHRQFKQCTVIHYFQLRAITIARVFSQLTGEGSMH